MCMLVGSTSAAKGDCAGLKRMDYTTKDCSDEGTENKSPEDMFDAHDSCVLKGDTYYNV